MEFIRSIREKRQTSCQNDIVQQAHDYIGLDDFDGKIYIAYQGTPLIPVDDKWTQKEIIAKLDETRKGYISYRMNQEATPMVAAMF